MALPFVLAGMQGLSTIMNIHEQGAQAKQAAKDYGTKQAGIKYNAEYKLGVMAASATNIEDDAIRDNINVQAAHLNAEAEAINNANASGVAGASVDQQITQSDRNAAKAKEAIENIRQSQVIQLEQNMVDLAMNAEMQQGVLGNEYESNSAADALNVASSVLSGFQQGR